MSFLGHEIEDEELFKDSKERAPKRPVSMSNKLSTVKLMAGIMFGTKSTLEKRRNRILTFDLLKDRNFNSSKELFDHIVSNSEYMCFAFQTHSIGSINSVINNTILMNFLTGSDNGLSFVPIMHFCLTKFLNFNFRSK
ncbi:MAG TPA: hypothetical protein VIY47_04855 [Ignavibacteriaceae bacterium]